MDKLIGSHHSHKFGYPLMDETLQVSHYQVQLLDRKYSVLHQWYRAQQWHLSGKLSYRQRSGHNRLQWAYQQEQAD